ncbi:MAG TPA: serine/threonine-protein kinase [Kofleriaceae bacterium]
MGQVALDRYLIEATLGSGGMGTVYRARHVAIGRQVAIKILHDHLVSDPAMVERFEREAALVGKLDHRNVVTVLDVGETPSHQKMMVLELVRGETLAELIAREGPLDRARVIAIVRQLLQGLEHAHAAGLIHRDLKPENVIIEHDDHGAELPKIVDFGIALLREDFFSNRRLTATGIVLGTPEFMAPEQAKGTELDARCDLFALGMIMYVMLAGKLPFDGTGIEVAIANLSKNPPPIATRSPGVVVDPLLEAFARRMMARRLGARMPSARTALRVLALVESDPVAAAKLLVPVAKPAVEAPPPPPLPPPTTSWFAAIAKWFAK